MKGTLPIIAHGAVAIAPGLIPFDALCAISSPQSAQQDNFVHRRRDAGFVLLNEPPPKTPARISVQKNSHTVYSMPEVNKPMIEATGG